MNTQMADNVRKVDFPRAIEGVRIGKIIDMRSDGTLLVDFPGNALGPIPGRFTHAVQTMLKKQPDNGLGLSVVVAFEENDPEKPIVLDTLHDTVKNEAESGDIGLEGAGELEDVVVDGKRVQFDAREEIVLKCGKASITLTRAGKIIIRGAYLLNRSSGVNKIKGASVQIN